MNGDLKEAALEYHRFPTAGKISVTPTKPLGTQRDLSLAYSPGVAEACAREVARRSAQTAYELTSRQSQSGRGRSPTARQFSVWATTGRAGCQARHGRQGRASSSALPTWTCSTSRSTARRPSRKNWSRSSARWPRPSAASIWKTSKRPNASRSSASSRASPWTSRFFMTISTARRSFPARRCSTPLVRSRARSSQICTSSVSGAGASADCLLRFLPVKLGIKRENIILVDTTDGA